MSDSGSAAVLDDPHSELLSDLHSESEELDRLVAPLEPGRWLLATPSPGWSLAHQIAHLTWTDSAALLAVTDPRAFAAESDKARVAPDTFVDEGLRPAPRFRPPNCSRAGATAARGCTWPCAGRHPVHASPGTGRR